MVVYIDMLIIENVIVNCFLLEVTARTVRACVKFTSVVIAGILGSFYVFVLFYPGAALLNTLPVKIIIAAIMIFITFRSRNKGFLLKAMAVFILYSMLLAGLCIFIQISEGNDIYDFTCNKLLTAIFIVFIAVNRMVIFIRERKQVHQLIYKIDIIFNSSHKSITGFLDTGNELREPVTNMPVILVDRDIYSCFCQGDYEKFYIPYRIFNGTAGRLEAFKPDYVNIHIGDEIVKKNALIALSNEKLADGGEYKALLSRGIFI